MTALRRRLLLLALSAVCLGAQGGSTSPLTKSYEMVKVGEGVYAFISEESLTTVVSGNSVVVVGDEGVLVVDTGSFPTLARRMIDDIRRKTSQPVRYIVHTHWHPDHLLGDGEFRQAFPGVVVLSTAFTRDRILDRTVPMMKTNIEKGPAFAQKLRQQLRQGKGPDGSLLDAAGKAVWEKAIADIEYALPEYRRASGFVPDVTFDRDLTVHLGAREVRISFLGRGNTGGDAVVYVPDSKVVATGDLVVYPTPYSFGSYPGEWIDTLRKLMAMDATTIVPGHGPVFHDWDYARTVVQLLESTRAQVRAAVDAGLDLEATRKRVDLEKFRQRLVGDHPDRNPTFQIGFVTPAVERAFQEAKGQFAEE
jgi:glyoxylase-like metal-dependent hydrolase (beta-lactamase superfamily II)